jgi:hypothetical protein
VSLWLSDLGFQKQLSESFVKHDICGDMLLDLDYSLLKDMGILRVGDMKRILMAIEKLYAASQVNRAHPTTSSSLQNDGDAYVITCSSFYVIYTHFL